MSGADYPDAVATAPHAGLRSAGPSPIALTERRRALGSSTAAWLQDLASCELTGLDIAGGPAAVPAAVEDAAVAALTPEGGCRRRHRAADGGVHLPGRRCHRDARRRGHHAHRAPRPTPTRSSPGSTYASTPAGTRSSGPLSRPPTGRGRSRWRPDAPGRYAFTATAVDMAGNTADARLTVQVVFPAPDATLVSRRRGRARARTRARCLQGRLTPRWCCRARWRRPASASATCSSPPDASFPEGCLRRLLSCAAEGEGLRCGAAPARLTEVFAQVDTTLQLPLRPTAATGVDDRPPVGRRAVRAR